jgi:hypothetical protein
MGVGCGRCGRSRGPYSGITLCQRFFVAGGGGEYFKVSQYADDASVFVKTETALAALLNSLVSRIMASPIRTRLGTHIINSKWRLTIAAFRFVQTTHEKKTGKKFLFINFQPRKT